MPKKKASKPDPVIFSAFLKWDKMRDAEIAEMLNCHPNTVYKYRKANSLPLAPRKPGSGAVARIDINKINMKKSIAENAKKHGCSYNWMSMLMKKRRAAAGFEF